MSSIPFRSEKFHCTSSYASFMLISEYIIQLLNSTPVEFYSLFLFDFFRRIKH
jgi:hypothetical protein